MNAFTIMTLGCKVNRYESEAISEQLTDQGWHLTDKGAKANLCVVNTCTVTGKAAMQSRQAVRRLVRSHPGALVVVTGCYAQVAPEVFASTLVHGASEEVRLLGIQRSSQALNFLVTDEPRLVVAPQPLVIPVDHTLDSGHLLLDFEQLVTLLLVFGKDEHGV